MRLEFSFREFELPIFIRFIPLDLVMKQPNARTGAGDNLEIIQVPDEKQANFWSG